MTKDKPDPAADAVAAAGGVMSAIDELLDAGDVTPSQRAALEHLAAVCADIKDALTPRPEQ